jgi:hypothetical protein
MGHFILPLIPFDVLDRIASFILDKYHPDFDLDPRDLNTLRALRLTSKSLYDVATAHLFGTVTWSTHPEDWARLHNIASTSRLAAYVTHLRYRDWHCGRAPTEDKYFTSFRNRYPGLFGPFVMNPLTEDAVRRGYELHRRRSEAQRDVVFTRASDARNLADMKRIIGYVQNLPRLRTITVSSKPIASPWLGSHVKYIRQGRNNIAAVHNAGQPDEAIECFPKLVGRVRKNNMRDNLVYSWLILRMLKLVLGVAHSPYMDSRNIAVEGDLFDFAFRMRDLTDILIDDGMGENALRTLDVHVKIEGGLDIAALHGGIIELWLKEFPNIQRFKFQPSVGVPPYTTLDIVHVRIPMFGHPGFRCLRHLTLWSTVVCSIENLLSLLTESAKTLKTLEIDNLSHYERGQMTFPPTPEGDVDSDGDDNANDNPHIDDGNSDGDAGLDLDLPPEPGAESESQDGDHYPRSPLIFAGSEPDDDDDTWVRGQYRGWDHCEELLRDIAEVGLELESFCVFPESYMRYRYGVAPPPRDALGYMFSSKAGVAGFLNSAGVTRVEGSRETIIRINNWEIRVHQPSRFPDFMLG